MLFSVVVSVYDEHQAFLPRVLTGLLNQTCQDFELLVVVDGAEPLLPFDPVALCRQTVPGRVVYRPRSRTMGNRERNYSLSLASGEYIAWLNADNLVYPNWLSNHRDNLAAHVGAVSVVNIQYWRGNLYRGILPTRLEVGEIDLLNFALPLRLARRLNLFGPDFEHLRFADWLAFSACAQETPITWDQQQPVCACHF